MPVPRPSIAVTLPAFPILALAVASALVACHAARAQEVLRPNGHYSPSLPDTAPEAALYLNFPFEKLKHAVPSLKGLAYEGNPDVPPASGQPSGETQLPAILSGTAQAIANELPKLPNLVSREDVYHLQSARDSSGPGGQMNSERWNRVFRYLILCRHPADGSVTIEESRTDGKGRPISSIDDSGPVTTPRGLGFAYQWLLFSAANQPEFRFRYLGRQTKDGKQTYVVAFAQSPEKVAAPANFQSGSKVVPFFLQGILWIDQSTYEIVLLRTDLLAPVPRVNLYQLSTEVHFTSVKIHGYDGTFWLPSQVNISSDQGAGIIEEDHRYSDYHLFHSTIQIVPAAAP